MNVNDNQHVLWLTSSYPRFSKDSASVFLRELSTALTTNNIQIDIICPDDIEVSSDYSEKGKRFFRFTYFLPKSAQKLAYGSGILPNLKNNKWLCLQIPFFILSFFLYSLYTIYKQKPTIIHAHWVFPTGFIAVIIGKLLGIPVIVTAHGGDAFSFKNSLFSRIKKWTIRNSTVWTSNTSATANAFGSELPSPIVIPMGVDFKRFNQGNRKKYRSTIMEQKIIILFVGRLVEKKGVEYLLGAFSQLDECYLSRCELWVVGDGYLKNKLIQHSQELGEKVKVKFLGKLPNEELPDIYASADIFVAPSITDSLGDTEGQGVILLEAMSAGLPVISTTVGGINEVIKNNYNGILVEQKSSSAIKEALLTLINDNVNKQLLTINSIEHAKNHDWNLIVERFIALYSKHST